MSAALVDLVSVGAQDAYITGEPQVSFGARTTNVTQTLLSNPNVWITSALSTVEVKWLYQFDLRVTF